jgi:hypothetical protein
MSVMDPVRGFLKERGLPDDVVRAGLEGLVVEWERTAEDVSRGYARGIDDYLSDLDGRQLLEDALAVAEPDQIRAVESRVRRADARMREHVRDVEDCLWGPRVAQRQRWTPDHHWWYFSVPRAPGPRLESDLADR